MAAFIFDASGIVKRYLEEMGSGWVHGLTDPAMPHELFLTRITLVEVTSAFARRGRRQTALAAAMAAVLAQFRLDAAHQFNILEITPDLLADTERMAEGHGLRGYDAVQLAASLELQRKRRIAGLSAVTLISADQELNAAGASEGLMVDDPNNHP